MTLEHLVANYGSFGLFVGASLEGEGIAMLGGIMSHQHLIGVWPAIIALALGSFLADQVFFLLGHGGRNSAIVRSVQGSAAGGRVVNTFNAHPDVFAFSLRFLYGLRMVGAVTIGTTDYPWPRFILLNAISALLWAMAWVTLGYVCGLAIAPLFERLSGLSHFVWAGVAVALCIAVVAVMATRRRRTQRLTMRD
ncbi:DedA family protein [Vreelandella lutescens]|uniref:DedA family protein n=1 Tax=Vreelandella lutescens TaxID=1602943 RepID=A0ABQ1NGW7_9GAMM|nr:DedA family protein [Halomonas lutescens]GGC76727.1 DedA family protein [Halomonas lutescens]